MPLTRDILLSWPKAELHCHLDGSLRLETLLALAREQGVVGGLPADGVAGLQEALLGIDRSESLEAYLAWFRYTLLVMQTPAALARIAAELVEDNAGENVRYLEVRFSPVLHLEGGLSLEQVMDAVLDGLGSASRTTGVRTKVIICGLRDRYASASLRLAELAVAYKNRGVTAFDLAGNESGFPSKDHLPAFYFARNHLLNLTIHAGESWGPDSIHQALFYGGAHRIGHGTSLYRDPALLKYVVDHQVPLEVCPTSNVQTRVVSGYAEHPVRRYVEAGVPVTINTDNRLFSRTTVTDELWHVYRHSGLTPAQVREIVLNGFRHSFLPWEDRQELLRSAGDAIILTP